MVLKGARGFESHPSRLYGDVPKWLKGAVSKTARGVKACESSNLSISVNIVVIPTKQRDMNYNINRYGVIPKRLKGAVLKIARSLKARGGSNPSCSVKLRT